METWMIGITTPVALSCIALIGYMIGRSQRQSAHHLKALAKKSHELGIMAGELEMLANRLRQNLAAHHSKVNRCMAAIQMLSDRHDGPHDPQAWNELHKILKPADELSHQIAATYDQLRQHSEMLTRFHP